MMRLIPVSLVLLAALQTALPSHAQTAASTHAVDGPKTGLSIIHAGILLDVPGRAPRQQQTLLIRDGKVVEVRPGFLTAAEMGQPEARLLDLKDSFVLPGLIDSHVHITGELGPRSQLRSVQDDPEDDALTGAYYAEKTLQAGFTTVRDLGAPGRSSLSLRDAIESGRLPGASIVAGGRMISVTAGHGDVNGFNDRVTSALTPYAVNVCNGAEDCRRAVREQVRNGADVIKLATTGGVLSNIAAGTDRQMFDDEIKAIVDTAKLLGKRVSAHAHGTGGINSALRAGVDSIEHGSYLDDESIRLFKQTGAWLVPTLLAGQTVTRAAQTPGQLTPAQQTKALQIGPMMQASLARAVKAGVKIAFGTDNGVGRHGTNAGELALMVEAGMSPAEVIKAATVNAADLLDRSSRIGTLEPGRDADIIAVQGDPLTDIRTLQTIRFVMRRGIVHRLNGERQAFRPVE
jgi:imidazolonepropionase-like amidohydrolase